MMLLLYYCYYPWQGTNLMVVIPIGNTWPEDIGWHIGCGMFVATLSVVNIELE